MLLADEPDLWDTQQVVSSESVAVPYRGAPLPSFQQVFWRVSIWDALGQLCAWSEPARFETAVMTSSDWCALQALPHSCPIIDIKISLSVFRTASWITRDVPPVPPGDQCAAYHANDPAPYFRTTFTLPGMQAPAIPTLTSTADGVSVTWARAYVSGLGYYELFVNGGRVGTAVLDPGWTAYNHTVLYAGAS